MIHLSFAQLLDFYAKAIASKPIASKSNVRSTPTALKASLNMFDFSPTVVGYRALMRRLLQVRRALRVVAGDAFVKHSGLNAIDLNQGGLSQGNLSLSILSARNSLHPARGGMT